MVRESSKPSAPCNRFPAFSPAGRAGASFKPQHLEAIAAEPASIGFVEVHAENYMGAGGPPHAALTKIRQMLPVSLHGVCMSIGGLNPLDQEHLARFAGLVERYEPCLVSEHLAWSTHDDVFYNDLLPLPYTDETLARVCGHINQVQDAIGRPMLLENPSTYVLFEESTWNETGFLREIVRRTGCGLLLDVSNVFISATNHGYSATEYLADFPLEHVGEIHLAGHGEQEDDEGAPLLIDSHDRPVADPVWTLYEMVISSQRPFTTLVEWDTDVPRWSVLRSEAAAAEVILRRHGHAQPAGKRHAAQLS